MLVVMIIIMWKCFNYYHLINLKCLLSSLSDLLCHFVHFNLNSFYFPLLFISHASERCKTNSCQWVYTSPECPAPWVAQFLLIGLNCQVKRTFAKYSCGSSYKCTWRHKHLISVRSADTWRFLQWRQIIFAVTLFDWSVGPQSLTLRSEGLTEDNRRTSLYSLDSCSAHSLGPKRDYKY